MKRKTLLLFICLVTVIAAMGLHDLCTYLEINKNSAMSIHDLNTFLETDKTDENIPEPGSYMCGHFSEDLVKNAAKQNLTLYFVHLSSHKHKDHMVVTTKVNGTRIFIEPQTDQILSPDKLRLRYSTYKIGRTIKHVYPGSVLRDIGKRGFLSDL